MNIEFTKSQQMQKYQKLKNNLKMTKITKVAKWENAEMVTN